MRLAIAAAAFLALRCGARQDRDAADAGRVRTAPGCASRGRVMVAFGAHSDEPFVQEELERLVASAKNFSCPPTDVALFVDDSKEYATLRHPDPEGVTVRVPFQELLKNGTAAFRVFVSHQLLMAALPAHLADDKTYEYVWVVEEDARMAQGSWFGLFDEFNESKADLVAYSRHTLNGNAALLPAARFSTRFLRAINNQLKVLDRGRSAIHGAFAYQMCKGAKWCAYAPIPREWFGIYRAKCAWTAPYFDEHAPAWHNPTAHGVVFHPVKVRAATSGREFAHFKCASQFKKEVAGQHRRAEKEASDEEKGRRKAEKEREKAAYRAAHPDRTYDADRTPEERAARKAAQQAAKAEHRAAQASARESRNAAERARHAGEPSLF